jgi:hypothetical protein
MKAANIQQIENSNVDARLGEARQLLNFRLGFRAVPNGLIDGFLIAVPLMWVSVKSSRQFSFPLRSILSWHKILVD